MNDLLLALLGMAIFALGIVLVVSIYWLILFAPDDGSPGITEQIIEVCTTNMGGDYETLKILEDVGCP